MLEPLALVLFTSLCRGYAKVEKCESLERSLTIILTYRVTRILKLRKEKKRGNLSTVRVEEILSPSSYSRSI